MNVACTKCGKAYRLPQGMAVPGMQIRMRCKSCGNEFDVAIPADAKPEVVAAPDPLGGVGNTPSDPDAPIGEITRHFIAQSGANRRNPWWKKLLFVAGLFGLPAGVLFLLSNTFHVVTITRTTDDGVQTQASFFSGEGVSGLKDLLSGEEKKRRAAVEKKKKIAVARPAGSPTDGATTGGLNTDEPGRMGSATGTVAGGDPSLPTGSLAEFYGQDDGKRAIAPKVRGDAPAQQHAGGLDDAAAAKVVASGQPAFQGCIEEGLRRNPNLKVGKVIMRVAVTPTGVVKSATIAPKQYETSDWAACLQTRAKRLVFPPFDGDDEAEIEVPLVVGVSL